MRSAHDDNSDEGFTLVELIIYSSLLVLVLAVVGGLFLSGLTATGHVRNLTAATTSGQAVVDSIETNVRNSSDFRVTVPSGTDQFLVARTATRNTTLAWQCVAWYYSAAGTGSIRFKESATAISAPNSTDLQTWTLVQQGVTPVSGRTTIFSPSSQQLAVTFSSPVAGRAPVVISGSATSRAGVTGNLTCF